MLYTQLGKKGKKKSLYLSTNSYTKSYNTKALNVSDNLTLQGDSKKMLCVGAADTKEKHDKV